MRKSFLKPIYLVSFYFSYRNNFSEGMAKIIKNGTLWADFGLFKPKPLEFSPSLDSKPCSSKPPGKITKWTGCRKVVEEILDNTNFIFWYIIIQIQDTDIKTLHWRNWIFVPYMHSRPPKEVSFLKNHSRNFWPKFGNNCRNTKEFVKSLILIREWSRLPLLYQSTTANQLKFDIKYSIIK